jgi:Effector-associated domain 1/Trypsin-like peptidase domain
VAPLTDDQRIRLREALNSAYPTWDDLDAMLVERFDQSAHQLSNPKPMPHVIREVILHAESRGRLPKLITAAFLGNPDNELLRELVTSGQLDTATAVRDLIDRPGGPAQDLLPHSDVLDAFHGPELQRVFDVVVGFPDVVLFVTTLLKRAGQVCLIEVAGATSVTWGTGFLVGPDLVLTNHHVLVDVLDGGVSPTGVRCRFDFRVRADHTIDHGVEYGLAADWAVASSPPSTVDTERTPSGPPDPDELDYALVRLDGRPGEDHLPGLARRDWMRLLDEPPALRPRLPLLIVQHPAGTPVKFAWNTEGVLGVNANETRVTYRVNTLDGSSGSPCLTLDLELAAVHHAGSPDFGAGRNEGIPIAAILRHALASGADAALRWCC